TPPAPQAVRGHRMHERRILHAAIAPERGHHTAQPLGPVARPERLAVEGGSLGDELDDAGRGHAGSIIGAVPMRPEFLLAFLERRRGPPFAFEGEACPMS